MSRTATAGTARVTVAVRAGATAFNVIRDEGTATCVAKETDGATAISLIVVAGAATVAVPAVRVGATASARRNTAGTGTVTTVTVATGIVRCQPSVWLLPIARVKRLTGALPLLARQRSFCCELLARLLVPAADGPLLPKPGTLAFSAVVRTNVFPTKYRATDSSGFDVDRTPPAINTSPPPCEETP